MLKGMRPAGFFNPRDYFFNATASTTSIIRDPLYEFLEMRVCLLCFILNFSEIADASATASWPSFHGGGAASESAVALRVPVSVWFVPNGDHLASRRRP